MNTLLLRQLALCILLTTLILSSPIHSNESRVVVVSLSGTITSMSVELVEEAIKSAALASQPLVLLLDTPGGSLDATLKIIEAVERSSIPVVGYVYPAGAKAWSAGTFILLSTHIAAMAPHALIGSARPVSMSPLGGAEPIDDPKVVNALTAFLVERAKMHGRNETASRLFIQENLNLSAEEAKRQGVVDVVASSIEDLLVNVDGRVVNTTKGDYRLQTSNAEVIHWSPTLRIMILHILSDPIVAYLLFILGIYTLIFGLATPGYGGEVLGTLLLILGLIGLGLTGVRWGALVLVGLGAILLAAELLAPGFGLLGGAGFFSILVGSLLLIPPGPWYISQNWLNLIFTVITVVPVLVGAFVTYVAYKVLQARRMRPILTEMVGEVAEVTEEISPRKPGFVIYRGEYWRARSEYPVSVGQRVKIISKEGPILEVQPEDDFRRSRMKKGDERQ